MVVVRGRIVTREGDRETCSCIVIRERIKDNARRTFVGLIGSIGWED